RFPEVHYFDLDHAKGDPWYAAHFPAAAAVRARESRVGERVQVGESTPYYLFHPLAPARIATGLPGVKVVVLLRDPVRRAMSAHRHEVRHGLQSQVLHTR